MENTPPADNSGFINSMDAELDAALSASFAKAPEAAPIENAAPKVEPEPIEKKIEPVPNEPKAEVKKEEVKAVEPEKPSLTPEQLDGLKPTDKGAWGAIKNANKNAHKMIEQRDSEIVKLKASLAERSSVSQKELEALRAEKTELEKYRAMVDIQADPEFVSKYDAPLEKSISGIKELIKGLGVTEATVNGIDFNDPARMGQIIDLVSHNKDRFTAAKIERKVSEYLQLKDKREETLQEHKNSYKETLEKKKSESFSKEAESEGRMLKHVEEIVSSKDKDGNHVIPFLNKKEVKEGANPGEVQAAKNHNDLVDLMNQKLKQVFSMKEPEHKAEIALAAVSAHYLRAQLNTALSELQKAKEEISKIASVNSETGMRKPPAPAVRGNNGEPPSMVDALEAHFSR